MRYTKQTLLLLVLACSSAARAGVLNDIQSFDWAAYFNHEYSECLESAPQEPAVLIESIIYHDFDHDGRQEAIVTGGSCFTGTAGPDVHSVFTLNTDGSIRELKFSRDEKNVETSGIPLRPIGNVNWTMTVKGELLCNLFTDGAGAGNPMEECYTLRNGQFVKETITYAKIFKTSFDCRKATTDREIVACRDPDMAKLDLELAREYRALLSSLPAVEKPALVTAQKKWLHELDMWTAYKWTDEVNEQYSARIQYLKDYSKTKATQHK